LTDDVPLLLAGIARRAPADPTALEHLVATAGVRLPDDYLTFMASSDGGDGDIGQAWIELWPVARVQAELESTPPHHEGIVLFAGDGANTVYGFDRFRDGEIVEGDWIGLNRDELITHGRTLADFLRSVASR